MLVIRLFAAGLAFLHVTVALAEARLALVIGNNEYAALPKLAKAVADADAVSSTLKGLGFNSPTVLHNQTGNQIRTEIANLKAKAREGDVVFIFFAGHGVAIDNVNYWLGTDMPLLHKKSVAKDDTAVQFS